MSFVSSRVLVTGGKQQTDSAVGNIPGSKDMDTFVSSRR
jgi:hypothetical protein